MVNFRNKKPFTIPDTYIDEDLVDFPLSLRINASVGTGGMDMTPIFEQLATGGDSYVNRKKISIALDAGDECYAEIEKWDHSSSEAVINFRCLAVGSGGANGYLGWDIDAAENTDYIDDIGVGAALAVGSGSYSNIWRMAEDPTISLIYDSVGSNEFTPTGCSQAVGQIGDAVSANGIVSDYLVSETYDDIGGADFEMSFWIYIDPACALSILVGNTSAPTVVPFQYYWRFVFNGTNSLLFSAKDASTSVSCTGTISKGTPHFIVVKRISDSWTIAIDDVVSAPSVATLTDIDAVGDKIVFNNINAAALFTGWIDDFMILKGDVHSDAWSTAQYYAGLDDLVTFETPVYYDIPVVFYSDDLPDAYSDTPTKFYARKYVYFDQYTRFFNAGMSYYDRETKFYPGVYFSRSVIFHNIGLSYKDVATKFYPGVYFNRNVVFYSDAPRIPEHQSRKISVKILLDEEDSSTATDITSKVKNAEIKFDKGSICNTLSIDVDYETYLSIFQTRQFNMSDEPVLEIFLSDAKHPTYPGDYVSQGKFFLEEPELSDTPSGIMCYMSGRNRAAKVLDPYSPLITKTWIYDTSAYAIANGLCESVGLGLTWDIADYPIPAGTFSAENATIGEILQTLAKVTNGYCRCEKNGDIWVKKEHYDLGESMVEQVVDFGLIECGMRSLKEDFARPPGNNYIEVIGIGSSSDVTGLQIIIEPQTLEADGISIAEVIVVATYSDGSPYPDGTEITLSIDDIGLATAGTFLTNPVVLGLQTIVDEPALLQTVERLSNFDFTKRVTAYVITGDEKRFQFYPPGYQSAYNYAKNTMTRTDVGAVAMSKNTSVEFVPSKGSMSRKRKYYDFMLVYNNAYFTAHKVNYPNFLTQAALDIYPLPYYDTIDVKYCLLFGSAQSPFVITEDLDFTGFACYIRAGAKFRVADGVTITFGSVSFESLMHYFIAFVPDTSTARFTIKFSTPVIPASYYVPDDWASWQNVVDHCIFLNCDVVFDDTTRTNIVTGCRFFSTENYVKFDDVSAEIDHCDFIRSSVNETAGILWTAMTTAGRSITVNSCHFFDANGYFWRETSTAGTIVKNNNVYYEYGTGIFNNLGTITLTLGSNEKSDIFPYCYDYDTACFSYLIHQNLKTFWSLENTYHRIGNQSTVANTKSDNLKFSVDLLVVRLGTNTDYENPAIIYGITNDSATNGYTSVIGCTVFKGSDINHIKFGLIFCDDTGTRTSYQSNNEYYITYGIMYKYRMTVEYRNQVINMKVYRLPRKVYFLKDNYRLFKNMFGKVQKINPAMLEGYITEPEWLEDQSLDVSALGPIADIDFFGAWNYNVYQSSTVSVILTEKLSLYEYVYQLRMGSTDIETLYHIFQYLGPNNKELTYDLETFHQGEYDYATGATIDGNLITITDVAIQGFGDDAIFLVTFDRKINRVIDEQQVSIDKYIVNVNWPVGEIDISGDWGVWLSTDPDHTGINYFGDMGAFLGKQITLGLPLPNPNQPVLVSYKRKGVGYTYLISGEALGTSLVRGESET